MLNHQEVAIPGTLLHTVEILLYLAVSVVLTLVIYVMMVTIVRATVDHGVVHKGVHAVIVAVDRQFRLILLHLQLTLLLHVLANQAITVTAVEQVVSVMIVILTMFPVKAINAALIRLMEPIVGDVMAAMSV